jgi:hypothetical protein
MKKKLIAYLSFTILLIFAAAVLSGEVRKLGVADIEWAGGNTGTEETITSPGGSTVTKIDASHIRLRNSDGTVESVLEDIAGQVPGSISITDNSIGPGKFYATSGIPSSLTFYRGDAIWDNISAIQGHTIDGGLIDGGTLIIDSFPETLRPIINVDVLPACGYDDYPIGAVVYYTVDYKLYRCGGDYNWTTAVALDDFPDTIQPVQVSSNLPGTCTVGEIHLLTTDGQLYRCSPANTWTVAVPAVNISGQLTDAQLAAIAAAKITGTITSTQIGSNQILTGHLAAGSVESSDIAAGTIVAGDISAGTITATQMAANTLTANEINTNAITADELAANSVVAGDIATGAINASSMISGAIITNAMLAGSIAASKLSVSELSAISANMGTLTAGTIQQSYTAPGDDNSTPGAGFKLSSGALEAYGNSHAFGGNLVSSDGNYMVSIGRTLTATGKTKRYPLHNATNFTENGRLELWKWETDTWVFMTGMGGVGAAASVYATDNTTGGRAFWANAYGTDGLGIESNGGTSGYGGVFLGGKGQIRLYPAASASAPTHSATKGTLWMTNNAVLYVNTDGSTTWAKVGAQ